MCGIAGVINGGDEAALLRMADIQEHRGPDDAGVKWFPKRNSGLAHRRLSILDLSPAGHQPMVNSRGHRWITYNGEIYNYVALRNDLIARGHKFRTECDTEVILAAFDEWGADCVKRFNGMFAFAIYDEESHILFMARDHLGVKPFYYAQKGDTFVFASEAKAIFEVNGFTASIEADAVISTLLKLWVPEPKTGFEDVFKLPAGHTATFENGKLKISEFWDVPIGISDSPGARSEDSYVEELRFLLEQAIERQLIADVPVGALLSGGLDSSLIVALMHKVNPSRTIKTYTIAFSEKDKKMEAMPDDAMYARILAKKLNTDHHEIVLQPDINELLPKILWHLDDPIADGAAINTYLIAKHAKESGVPVLLGGMGADEVFGGYRRHLAVLMGERYRRVPSPLRYAIERTVKHLPVAIGGRGIKPVRWAKIFLRSCTANPLDSFICGFTQFSATDVAEALAERLSQQPFEELYPIRRYYEVAEKVKGCSIVEKMSYLDTKLFLPGLNLAYSDKATMAASVESRPPLIDTDIIEFAARVPAKYKIHGRTQKYLLKKAAEAYLPHEIIYRPKAPFGTPIRAWMQSGLDDMVKTTFANSSAPHKHYMKQDYPLSLLSDHKSGKSDNAHRLWGSMVAARWIDDSVKKSTTK